MTRYYMLLIISLWCSFAIGQPGKIITSPEPIPDKEGLKHIFLGGSIDMGKAVNWQDEVRQRLSNDPVVLLNPRRADWNKEWQPVKSDSNFRQQVEWELAALDSADRIIMYFAPQSQSPISVLELGLYASSGKLLVVCPEGYWRKGNVDIVCEKYNIPMFDTLEELISSLKEDIYKDKKSTPVIR